MIQLENLTSRQVAFCEVLWELQSVEDVENFIQSLPKSFQDEARAMKSMIEFAVVDDMLDGSTDLSQVKDILNRF
jgi:hypothetical protein